MAKYFTQIFKRLMRFKLKKFQGKEHKHIPIPRKLLKIGSNQPDYTSQMFQHEYNRDLLKVLALV